jgi:glycosyltransferase involved in cell wall biosynthesis
LSRILFLTESFHPVLGGGETHIRALGAHLVKGGVPATVVTRRGDARWASVETVDGIRVIRVAPAGPGRTGKYLMVPAALRALWRQRRAYDVLVVRGTRVLGLPGLVAGRLLGKPVVLQAEINGEMSGEAFTWGTGFERGPVAGLLRGLVALRNLLMRDADAFVAMSRAIHAEFEAAGVAAERIAHLPHGIDTSRFRPASATERGETRARLGLPENARIVCYTGRLLRGKGLDTLVEAFARVADADAAAHLVLVGSGEGQALSVEADLLARVRDHGLRERVTFAGRVLAVEDYLRASDVFAFPSLFEALGISLIEAAACGLPAVGSRTGGIVDVIEEGETGLLVEPGDAGQLTEALRVLLADEELRMRMGRQAARVARSRFDFADSAVRYRCLFAELQKRAVS